MCSAAEPAASGNKPRRPSGLVVQELKRRRNHEAHSKIPQSNLCLDFASPTTKVLVARDSSRPTFRVRTRHNVHSDPSECLSVTSLGAPTRYRWIVKYTAEE
ncbi:hypothetical protein VTI28DRAFT_8757 [Corynascus sepedonium]